MTVSKEEQILAAVRKALPPKKRVTFFLTEDSKAALKAWCEEKKIPESAAIEEMIKATVPIRYFKEAR